MDITFTFPSVPPQAVPEAPLWLVHGGHPGDVSCSRVILSSLHHTSTVGCSVTGPCTDEELEFKCTEIEEEEDSSNFLIHWSSAFNVLK